MTQPSAPAQPAPPPAYGLIPLLATAFQRSTRAQRPSKEAVPLKTTPVTLTPASLTFPQIATLWMQAGGNAQYANIAAAVAMAETGGDPEYQIMDGGQPARGLWALRGSTLANLVPMTNARAAIALSRNGTDWSPWPSAWTMPGCSGTCNPTDPSTPAGHQLSLSVGTMLS